jgi:hypothetical protein
VPRKDCSSFALLRHLTAPLLKTNYQGLDLLFKYLKSRRKNGPGCGVVFDKPAATLSLEYALQSFCEADRFVLVFRILIIGQKCCIFVLMYITICIIYSFLLSCNPILIGPESSPPLLSCRRCDSITCHTDSKLNYPFLTYPCRCYFSLGHIASNICV